MKISFILSSLWLSGGVQVIIEYANRLTARGHQVTLVAPCDAIDARMSDALQPGVVLRRSGVPRGHSRYSLRTANLAWSLARTVPQSDVIISTHTPTTVAGFLAGHILRRGKLAWLFADYHEMFVDRPIELWLMRNALRWHNLAMTLSEYSRQELDSYAPGRTCVVGLGLCDPKGLDAARLNARDVAHDPKTILYLGDGRPRKGLADFMAATRLVYQSAREIQLLIVSKEPLEIESDVPCEFILNPGRVELARLYATCGVFVSASWREGFGLPPLEAMACGAPVVLTDSGGVREYARHSENCLMVPPRAPEALAEAILCVLSRPELTKQLREAGPRTAAEFTWDTAVDRMEQVLVHLAADGSTTANNKLSERDLSEEPPCH